MARSFSFHWLSQKNGNYGVSYRWHFKKTYKSFETLYKKTWPKSATVVSETLELGWSTCNYTVWAAKISRKHFTTVSGIKAVKEDWTVRVESENAVIIFPLWDAQRYGWENGKATFSDLRLSELVWNLHETVWENRISILIKLLNETSICANFWSCSIVKTSFLVVILPNTTSYKILFGITPMEKNSVYLHRSKKTKTSMNRCIIIILWQGKKNGLILSWPTIEMDFYISRSKPFLVCVSKAVCYIKRFLEIK